MLTKILLGVILTLSLACSGLYLMLDSKSKSLEVSELNVKTLSESLEKSSEELQKAQSLRKKHEEIIAELFQDQDTTQEQFDDLESKFAKLKGSSCKPQGVATQKRVITDVKEDAVVKLDLSEHKRLLSEAACLAGNGSACPSTAPPE